MAAAFYGRRYDQRFCDRSLIIQVLLLGGLPFSNDQLD